MFKVFSKSKQINAKILFGLLGPRNINKMVRNRYFLQSTLLLTCTSSIVDAEIIANITANLYESNGSTKPTTNQLVALTKDNAHKTEKIHVIKSYNTASFEYSESFIYILNKIINGSFCIDDCDKVVSMKDNLSFFVRICLLSRNFNAANLLTNIAIEKNITIGPVTNSVIFLLPKTLNSIKGSDIARFYEIIGDIKMKSSDDIKYSMKHNYNHSNLEHKIITMSDFCPNSMTNCGENAISKLVDLAILFNNKKALQIIRQKFPKYEYHPGILNSYLFAYCKTEYSDTANYFKDFFL